MDRYVFWHPETRSNCNQCLLSYLEQQLFLLVPTFSLVGSTLVMIYRDKTNALVVPCDIATQMWHCHTKPPSTTCHAKKKKKKEAAVNSNQSNYTGENSMHIASIIVILNNGYLIWKICVIY